jgi:hypothetical protein
MFYLAKKMYIVLFNINILSYNFKFRITTINLTEDKFY